MGKKRGAYYLRRKVNMGGYMVAYIDEQVKLKPSIESIQRYEEYKSHE